MRPASFRLLGLILIIGGAAVELTAVMRWPDIQRLGITAVIIGASVLCTSVVCNTVEKVNRPADEAFTHGYESGYDKGWRDGHEHARPVLVSLKGADDGVGRETAERQVPGKMA